jgi:ribosomal protein L19E
MDAESLPWIIIAGLGGVVTAMVAYWAKSQIERIGSVETRADQREQVQVERVIDHTGDIARLQAKVEALEQSSREERNRCGEIGERTARLEAFQAWAEPLLERAVKAIETANAFQARIDERLVTLFKGIGAATQRLERLQTSMGR